MNKKTVRRRSKAHRPETPPAYSAELNDPKRKGGIIGGKGYDFQKRFAVARIPQLLAGRSFTHLLYEGFEDIDINFGNIKGPSREAIQVKDHRVDLPTLKAILQNFWDIERSHPHSFARFRIACKGLGNGVTTLAASLKRLRGAEPSFKGGRKALPTTLKGLRETIAKLGLEPFSEFIIEKVYFEDGLANFGDDEQARNIFISNLQELSTYSRKHKNELTRAYDALFTAISRSNGQSLSRDDLKKLINAALKKPVTKRPETFDESVVNVGEGLELAKGGKIGRATGRKREGTASKGKERTIVFKRAKVRGVVKEIVGVDEKAGSKDSE